MKRPTGTIILAVLFLLATAAHFYPDHNRARILQFLIVSQVTFLIGVAVFWVGRKLDFDSQHRRIFTVLIIIAIAARLLMLIGTEDHWYLSDDVFRYVWDGKTSAHGINPYLYNPAADELVELRDDQIYPYINNKHLPTIYPPVAQNFFVLSYLLTEDSPLGFKIISAIMELLTIVCLAVLLRCWHVPRGNLLLYLYAPLVMIEFWMSAHVDVLAMPFFVAALISLHSRRPVLVGVFLGLASMVKLPGLLFAPVLFFHFKGRQRWWFALACAVTVVASYLPYAAGSNWAFLGSLGVYLRDWQFFASVYFLLKYGLGLSWARPAILVMFIAWLIYMIVNGWDIRSKLFGSYAGHLCLTPTFYPWYFVWLYPMLCWNLSLPFIYLSGTTILSYHVLLSYYRTGEWEPIVWLGSTIYLVFYGLLIWWSIRNRNRQLQNATQ